MPRISAFKYDYMQRDLSDAIRGRIKQLRLTQGEAAEMLDMTPANFSTMLKKGRMSYVTLVRLFDLLNFEDEEILKVMKC